jgi:hypothetical protein
MDPTIPLQRAILLLVFCASALVACNSPHNPSTDSHHATLLRRANLARLVNSDARHPARGDISVAATKGTTCPIPISNGSVLNAHWGILRVDRGNVLRVVNRSGRNAIVKIRDMMLGDTRAAIFVAKGQAAHYDRVPDGGYLLDYALGDTLDSTCMTFTHIVHAAQIGAFHVTSDIRDGRLSSGSIDVVVTGPAALDAGLDLLDSDTFNSD